MSEQKNSYIVNERPEDMSQEAYKQLLKNQNAALKAYKKGTIVNLKKYKKK